MSRDLTRCVSAGHIAPTLQHAMDHWHEAAPRLMRVYDLMNEGPVAGEKPFDPKDCASPLPRAYQWADGSAYVTHVELVRKARGAEMPPSFWTDPLMYQGGSDSFIGPCDPILAADEAWGIDFEAEVAVITDDVPMGTKAGARGEAHQAADAGERRVAAQSDPGGTGQEFRLLPVQARERVLAGRGHAGRTDRSVERRQGPSAAAPSPTTAKPSAIRMPAWT